jgi:hypothetical protein
MEWHAGRKSIDNTEGTIIVHLPTPVGSNAGGVPWPKVMMNAKPASSTIPWHTRKFASEAEALRKGQIIEVNETVVFSSGTLTNAQQRDEIRTHVAQMKIDIVSPTSDLYKSQIAVYEWFGYAENLPI